MKYTDIKNKIFNKKKGKIVFSDEIIIYETEDEVKKFFKNRLGYRKYRKKIKSLYWKIKKTFFRYFYR